MDNSDSPDLLQVSETLKSLVRSADARGALLIDSAGMLITSSGRLADEEIEDLGRSAGRSFDLLREKGEMFFEGRPVHCSLVGDRTILVVAFDEPSSAERVRFCAQHARAELFRIFQEMSRRIEAEDQKLPEEFSREATRRIERLPDQ